MTDAKPKKKAKTKAKARAKNGGETIKIAFVVNRVATEQDDYTTIRLARKAVARGHTVALIGLGDFIYDWQDGICAMATISKIAKFDDDTTYLAHLQDPKMARERINLSEYDILMLRSDPAAELTTRNWAPSSGLLFAQLASLRNTIVLNDPKQLTDAVNKTYFQGFPEAVRPETSITREPDEISRFLDAHDGKGVIKPLQGSGGQGVFLIDEDNRQNLNQIVEAVIRDGYAIVQEYLPAAKKGDLRMITLNGRPLKVDDTYACIHRFSQTDDHRSNISAGGGVEMVVPDEVALQIAEIVGPKLIDDGMYLTGLDIAGDKMMEINVDTPGGLNFMEDLSGVDFSGAILDDLERKVRLQGQYGGTLTNRQLAVL
ncbi:ATP-grasp domain-containing protein [Allopontixanthobacter sediminis]|uniref:glutathione synthase n=1 Tax=Allopontixanthobacter sediminis TaxID=1689985 RepID=UPI0019292796|nr:glutathione synthase [Allopontixanthobacter sediminis]